MKPVKILHVFGVMNRGGAELRTLDVMRHLDPRQFQFHFCTLKGIPGELDDEIRSMGGAVHPCRLDAGFAFRFRRLLRQEQFDVVHAHVHYFSGYCLRLAAKERVRSRIAHFRSTAYGWRRSLRKEWQNRIMKRWIDRYATRILSVSRAAMEIPWGANWRTDPRCEVVHNGIDLGSRQSQQPTHAQALREPLSIPCHASLIVHVGRMVPSKNQVRCLTIFKHIRERMPHARLLFVGDSGDEGYRSSLREAVQRHRLEPYVHFAGERSDVLALVEASDLFLFPSQLEGMPGVVLESCAAGTPVLATDLPGIKEISETIMSGVQTLPLSMTDREWAEAAIRILSPGGFTPSDREELRRRFLVSDYEISACVKKLQRIWQE